MLKLLISSGGLLRSYASTGFCKVNRFYMSLDYNCNEEWKKRLQSPMLNKITISDFFRKVKQVADSGGTISPIDIEILANKLEEIEPVSYSFVEQLFQKFRHTKECLDTTPSTSGALLRTLMEHGDYERLFKMLDDKINYGIFLDMYISNLLLDHFITKNLYREAAKIVFDLMLQEDFNHPITAALSYYACHLYIKNKNDIKLHTPPEIPTNLDVVYRKVPFIENPWYDDHFDLYSDTLKLGKSLTMLARSYDDVVSRGYLVIGYLLYQKIGKALDLLNSYTKKHDQPILLEAHLNYMEMLLQSMETIEHREAREPGLRRIADLMPFFTKQQKDNFNADFQAIKNSLITNSSIEKDNIADKKLEQLVKDSILKEEHSVTNNQKKLYNKWTEERDALLEEQVKQLKIKMKKDKIAQKLIDLTSKEEKLRFYEEKTNIELKISEQPEYPKIKDVVLEEQFVAPPGERKSGDPGKKKLK